MEQGTHPEDKVLGCHWLYDAASQGHAKARFQLGRQLALGDGVQINPQSAMLRLQGSANIDKNVDAYLLVAQLLQKGDVFEKNLPKAYLALLKAQALGADVTEELKQLIPLLTCSNSDLI